MPGRLFGKPNTSIGYLDQYAEIDHSLTMRDFLKSAFSRLYQIEAEMASLYEKAANGDMGCLGRAAQLQECLEMEDFYSIDTRIEQVASGLGLFAVGLDRPIDQMSGGQRAKVILAKLLLENRMFFCWMNRQIFWTKNTLHGLQNIFPACQTLFW